MRKISLATYLKAMADPKKKKALALYLFVKHRYAASVIPQFTYKKLCALTGLCFTALKKRIHTLYDMDLVGKIGDNLLFKSCRDKHVNIEVWQITHESNVKDIETGLNALYLVYVQSKKDYIKQLAQNFNDINNAKGFVKEKNGRDYKSLKKEMRKRGILWGHFKELGISYRYLARKLKVGLTKVSNAIKYGIKNNMFVKHKHIENIYPHNDQSTAYFWLSLDDTSNKFITKHGIIAVYANTYTLCRPQPMV